MSHSYAGPFSFTCDNCGQAMETALWMIIDTAERPDLVERIQDSTIHAITCPHCGAQSQQDVPLLIYQPVAEPHVLFSPAQRASAEDNIRDINLLLSLLRQRLVGVWRDEWVTKGIQSIPRSGLVISRVASPGVIRDLRDELREALEAEQRYLATRDGAALAAVIPAWERVLHHPVFSSTPQDFRLRVWNDAGMAYLRRYQVAGHDDDLNVALALWQQALDTLPPDSLERHRLLGQQGNGLRDRYIRSRRLDDLEETIRLYQKAVHASPADSPNRSQYLYDLGVGLRRRYDSSQQIEVLEEAISVLRQAVEAVPLGTPDRPAYLNSLGAALGTYYYATRRLEGLAEAVRVLWQAVVAVPAESPNRELYLNNLRNSLRERSTHTNQLDDLDEAIQIYRQVLVTTPPGLPSRPGLLTDLGNALLNRYPRVQQMEDLDEAIRAYRQVVDEAPAGLPNLAVYLNNLGSGLHQRYDYTGRLEDLDEAIGVYRQALDAAPTGSPNQLTMLKNLDLGLRQRYTRTGRLDDLDEAIQILRRALDAAVAGSTDQLSILKDLGMSLIARYERSNQLDDLEQVIRVYRQAVEATPVGSPDQPGFLSSLGIGLRSLYRQTIRLEDLKEAISILRQAVNVMPAQSPGRPVLLNALGLSLLDLRLHTGGQDDRVEVIEEAIRLFREAVDATLDDSSEQTMYLNNLGNGLVDRYHRTGELDNLDEAIRTWQEAIDRAPTGFSERPMFVNDLSRGLHQRYVRTGQLDDLDRAIRLLREAVQEVPTGSPGRLLCLSNLGIMLRERYDRSERLDDLEEAINVSRQAVDEVAVNSSYRPTYLSNLGNCLQVRYARTRQFGDLEEAIERYRDALDAAPAGSIDVTAYLTNLGAGLRDRYAYTRQSKDLDAAIGFFQQALQATPPTSPDWPSCLNNLGSGLQERYTHTRQPQDLDAARAAYREACARGLDVAPAAALASARNWGNWALDRREWEEAAEAYRYGLQVVERLLATQLTRPAKETWMRDAQGLPARAAYALARAGDLTAAIETLEGGRARLLAEALELSRHNLGRLPELGHADLYERYRRAADQWQVLQIQIGRPEQPVPARGGEALIRESLSGEALGQALTSARRDLDAAIEAIRQVPGYEDFYRSLTFERIQQVAAAGAPLVYLVVTPAGSVALVVQGSGQGSAVEALWLDERTEQDLPGALEEPAKARLSDLSDYVLPRPQPDDEPARQARMAPSDLLIRWLWDVLVGPLVEHLAARDFQQAVLIPTGLLDRLPLHAAWTEDPAAPTGRRYALDRVAFSYAPSARALAAAQPVAAAIAPDAILAVDNPDGSLHFSYEEVETALSYFPPEGRKILRGEEATHAAVIRDLPTYPVLHFATHGRANLSEPLNSSLLVSGKPPQLTLRDVLDLRLERARLAVLSACETGIPGAQLPDEVVGLPAGLVQAGVASVVASLWSVDDQSTAMLMEHFYQQWLVEGMSPVMALRSAQIWLRDLPCLEIISRVTVTRDAARARAQAGDTAARLLWSQLDALREMLLDEYGPQECPFASPYYWAAFSVSGAA